VVKLLLEYGADSKRKNKEGDSPAVMAKYAEDKELQRVLRETKAIHTKRPAAAKKSKPGAKKKPPQK
jgi:ankyrin repeat protein